MPIDPTLALRLLNEGKTMYRTAKGGVKALQEGRRIANQKIRQGVKIAGGVRKAVRSGLKKAGGIKKMNKKGIVKAAVGKLRGPMSREISMEAFKGKK